MLKGICPKCKIIKLLTKHSKTGHHNPPYARLCRECHDKIHGIKRKEKISKKYQPGTPKFKKKKK